MQGLQKVSVPFRVTEGLTWTPLKVSNRSEWVSDSFLDPFQVNNKNGDDENKSHIPHISNHLDKRQRLVI